MGASQEFIDLIRELTREEMAKRGGVVLCQIARKKDDLHYDIYECSDKEHAVSDVANMTKFSFSEGDFVYVYKVGGRLSNAYICCKAQPR